MEREYLSTAKAAAVVGVSAATVRRWAAASKLRVYWTPGGHRRFDPLDCERIRRARVEAAERNRIRRRNRRRVPVSPHRPT